VSVDKLKNYLHWDITKAPARGKKIHSDSQQLWHWHWHASLFSLFKCSASHMLCHVLIQGFGALAVTLASGPPQWSEAEWEAASFSGEAASLSGTHDGCPTIQAPAQYSGLNVETSIGPRSAEAPKIIGEKKPTTPHSGTLQCAPMSHSLSS
jgi:hypothetical protein